MPDTALPLLLRVEVDSLQGGNQAVQTILVNVANITKIVDVPYELGRKYEGMATIHLNDGSICICASLTSEQILEKLIFYGYSYL